MIGAATGLTPVPTEALVHLLRLLYKGELAFPLTMPELARVGLQATGPDLLLQLRGLDARGAQAVVVCVLAERKAREEGTPVGVPRH